MTERTGARRSLADKLRSSSPMGMAAAGAAVEAVSLMNRAVRGSGVRQSELAARIGVSEGRVSQVLNGDGNVKVSTLARFLRAAGYRLQISAAPIDGSTPPLLTRRRRAQGGEVFMTAKSAPRLMATGVAIERSIELSKVHPRHVEAARIDWIANLATGEVERVDDPSDAGSPGEFRVTEVKGSVVNAAR